MSFAVNNKNGEHLGFILFSGDEKNGDCIFRCLPNKSELFDTEEANILNQLQEIGEFSYSLISDKYEIINDRLTSQIVINNLSFQINGVTFLVKELNT